MFKGCDLSHHQRGVVDFAKLKDEVDFVILRAGYTGYRDGQQHFDQCFTEFADECTEHGIDFGAYWFSQAINVKEAIAEADALYEAVRNYTVKYPVYIDTEYSNNKYDGRADGLSVAERTNVVKAFCRRMEERGYYCGYYCSESWLRNHLDMEQLAPWDWWAAKWSTKPPSVGVKYGMWQYTNNAKLNGVLKRVDMNCTERNYPHIIETNALNIGKAKRLAITIKDVCETTADKIIAYLQEIDVDNETIEVEVY